MSKKETILSIIELVGSEENITAVSHCFTRLRLRLVDRSKVNETDLKALPAVLGLVDRGGELQIVMGNAVSDYYEEAAKILTNKATGAIEEKLDDSNVEKTKMSFIDKIADISSGIFIPIIGVLAGCGTLQGLVALLTFLNIIDTTSGTFIVLNAMGKGIFYFFPFFLAHTAATKFGGRPFYSMAIAATIMYPDIISAASEGLDLTFMRIDLLVRDYSSSVLPIIVAAWLAAVVEKKLRKVIPDVLKMIFVPLLTILIVGALTLLVLGPVLTYTMNAITVGINYLYALSPIITGTLVGAIWQLLVFLGLSKAFMPIFPAEFATSGFSYFGAITFFVAVFGQAGAVFGIAAKTKEKNIRSVTIGSGISALFGVTEPALFGINVPAKKPFLFGSIAAAIGGFISSVFGGKLYSLASGILGVPSLINPESGLDKGFYAVIIGSLVSFFLAFFLTYSFGWNKELDEEYHEKL